MRSKRASTNIQNLNPIVEDVFSSANIEIEDPMAIEDNLREGFIYKVPHVLAIQESNCDKLQWHIARLPKTSAKAYFASKPFQRRSV